MRSPYHAGISSQLFVNARILRSLGAPAQVIHAFLGGLGGGLPQVLHVFHGGLGLREEHTNPRWMRDRPEAWLQDAVLKMGPSIRQVPFDLLARRRHVNISFRGHIKVSRPLLGNVENHHQVMPGAF
jgi:hypothetical protein